MEEVRVDVLIPFYEDTPGRREILEHNLGLWSAVDGAVVLIGDDPAMAMPLEASTQGVNRRSDGVRLFSRARARNRAFAQGSSPWTLCYDSDVPPPPAEVLLETVARAATGDVGWAPMFASTLVLTPAGTRAYLQGLPTMPDGWGRLSKGRIPMAMGPTVVRRDVLESVGGYDERFEGWGWEDSALREVLQALRGRPHGRPTTECLSLSLDHEELADKVSEGSANRELFEAEYKDLDRDRATVLLQRRKELTIPVR